MFLLLFSCEEIVKAPTSIVLTTDSPSFLLALLFFPHSLLALPSHPLSAHLTCILFFLYVALSCYTCTIKLSMSLIWSVDLFIVDNENLSPRSVKWDFHLQTKQPFPVEILTILFITLNGGCGSRQNYTTVCDKCDKLMICGIYFNNYIIKKFYRIITCYMYL